MVTGCWQPNANVALVEWARKLLTDVEATGRTVHWVHVKGHSADTCRPGRKIDSRADTKPLCKSKLFINGSSPILIMTWVLGHPRRADAKVDIKNYQGPTTARENVIQNT
jgi:hypothetical protein